MKHISIIFSILISCVISIQDAFPKSVDTDLSKAFLLQDSTRLTWVEEYTDTFDNISGFLERGSDEGRTMHLRIINGAADTTYVNSQMGSWVQTESLLPDIDSYRIRTVIMSSDSQNALNRTKKFDYDNRTWKIYNYYDDWSYFSGSGYDADRSVFYSISDDDNFAEDKYMTKLAFFILVISAFFIIIPTWHFEDYAIVWIILGLAISLILTFILKLDIITQLFLPLICLVATAFLFYMPGYEGIVSAIGQTILGIVIIIFFAYKQFNSVNEQICFQDGYKLNITWKRGTGVIKRAYVRKMFLNMAPVTVRVNDEEYTLYVSKYEFSEGNLSITSGEALSCFSAGIKRPLYEFSFREAQLVLEYLNLLTGVKLDFLSYDEWSSLAKNKRHSPNNLDYYKVTKGEASDNGLLNITSNMPEFTSTYYGGNYRVSMAADTMYRSYNNVIVAGSAYKCTDSLNFSIVNKNVRNGLAGFRLIFRPDDIGARKFTINGYLRNDKKYTGLPERINLLSIDGVSIEDIANYESFEELLIESRLKNRRLKGVDMSSDAIFHFDQPAGLEYYDFEPVFSFVKSHE